jgi:hypothetical protein
MNEKRRRSILFHLLVPGEWQTNSDRPVPSANFCSSHFQGRGRTSLLPRSSAAISTSRVVGYKRRPSARQQQRIDATLNALVSWSVPTSTNPVFAPGDVVVGEIRRTLLRLRSACGVWEEVISSVDCFPPAGGFQASSFAAEPGIDQRRVSTFLIDGTGIACSIAVAEVLT